MTGFLEQGIVTALIAVAVSPEFDIVTEVVSKGGALALALIVWWELRQLRTQLHLDAIELIKAQGETAEEYRGMTEAMARLTATVEAYDRRRRPIRDTAEDPRGG